MATNLFHQLSITAASATLGLAVFTSLPATGATVTYNFEFKRSITDFGLPPLQPPITGSFSYEDRLLVERPTAFGASFYSSAAAEYYDIDQCLVYSNRFFGGSPCFPSGSYVSLTDFQINFSEKIFSKSTAKYFDLIWDINPFYKPPYPYGGYSSDFPTGLRGTATWENPYLNLTLTRNSSDRTHFVVIASSTIQNLCGNCATFFDNGLYSYAFTVSEFDFSKQDTTTTPVPEGRQELALLGLGILGFASLLKKKIASLLFPSA
jgi:hypothetical protein